MKKTIDKIKTHPKQNRFRKILKIIGFSFLGLITILLFAAVGLSVYFNKHKEVIVADINKQINENIKGTISIGDISYTLVKGFPNFALTINNVVLKDSLWAIHKKTLLTAKEIEVHLNIKKLILDKEIDIEKIKINNAIINMYVDKNGISNSDIFKPKPKDTVAKPKRKTIIQAIALEEVEFISENIKRDKLFDFDVTELEGKINYNDDGWQTDLFVNTLAKSMAFKLAKGSFIKEKRVEGKLALTFSAKENKITVVTEKLGIGDDEFDITAHFNLDKKNPLFDLDINTEILWGNASRLLSANILRTLKKIEIKKPIKVNCTIVGNMSVEGDPVINVKAIVKDNELKTPDGTFTNCNFNGKYNNTFKKGMGTSDENSAIILTDFSAAFKSIPFSIPNGMIYNLTLPKASGTFKSKFDVMKINQFIDDDLMNFSEGTADVNLKFNVNLANFKINKPLFSGSVLVKNTTLNYIPKSISFKNTDILLNFTEDALTIDKIKFTTKNNTEYVLMKGKIDNFLDLYYHDPSKMIINWDIYSPDFNLRGFLATLAKKDKTASDKKIPKNKTPQKMVSGKMQEIVDNCQVNMKIRADKMRYNRLIGKKFTSSIVLKNGELYVNNSSLYTCNGHIAFDARLIPNNDLYNCSGNVTCENLDLTQILTSFNNFGITSFQSNDVIGTFSSNISVSGSITQNGELINKSLSSKIDYKISNGYLINFDPLEKIGKVAFPNRNVNKVKIDDFNSAINIKGELVTIDMLKVNTNILNFDLFGIYSFGNGTDIKMTIPLRDSKDDYKITDSIQRASLRYKGVVVHLQAVDGPDGKIQIKLDPQDVKISSPFKKSKSTKK